MGRQQPVTPESGNKLRLRKIIPEQDCDALRSIFCDAVMQTAAAHYSLRERQAWAEWSAHPILARRLLSEGITLVAEAEGRIAGFAQLNPMNYVRMLYVAPQFSRQGAATRMLRALELIAARRGLAHLETHASRTSRTVFGRAGFTLNGPAPTERDGVVLERFSMSKSLK